LKELVLIDVDYSNGGHNKVYADAVFRGAGGAVKKPLNFSPPSEYTIRLQRGYLSRTGTGT